MISYIKIGIISIVLIFIGILGIILQALVPNLTFIFNSLFLLGILGLTVSYYSYSLHLYEFNSVVLSNLTFSSVIVLYLLSFNVISYSTILQLLVSGTQGWFSLALYFALILAGSWVLLFIGHSIRIFILSIRKKPILKNEMPNVYGAFAIILIVIVFVMCNTIIASDTLSSYEISAGNVQLGGNTPGFVNNNPGLLTDNNQQYAPIVNLIEGFFNEQFNPQIAQEHDRVLQQQWDTGISLFISGYSKCLENSSAVTEIPALKPGLDITTLCYGIEGGASDLEESNNYLSGISDGSPFAVSKQSSLGLLVPIIENISWSCQSSETVCEQAKRAAQIQDDVQFQNSLEAIQSNIAEMRVDYNGAAAVINNNSNQTV